MPSDLFSNRQSCNLTAKGSRRLQISASTSHFLPWLQQPLTSTLSHRKQREAKRRRSRCESVSTSSSKKKLIRSRGEASTAGFKLSVDATGGRTRQNQPISHSESKLRGNFKQKQSSGVRIRLLSRILRSGGSVDQTGLQTSDRNTTWSVAATFGGICSYERACC